MMRRAKVNYLDKEDMMGHTTGLEKHYERYNEEDFERFPEYQKAIPFLTISNTERLNLENKQLEQEMTELEAKNKELERMHSVLNKDPNVVAENNVPRNIGSLFESLCSKILTEYRKC